MNNVVTLVALVSLLAIGACAQVKKESLKPEEVLKPIGVGPGDTLTVRYIANEGVLVASGNRQILIDSLHREYRPAYLFPPLEMQRVIENARAPYDKINVLLVSHIHLDHFHPESVGRYLTNNPKAIFASSAQVVDEVSKGFAGYSKIRPQIKPVVYEWKKSAVIDHKDIRIKFLSLRHSSERWKDIQNLGHVIEIGGKKLLHVGDAEMTAENFAAFNLAEEKIDVAFIPYWYLSSAEGRALVKEQFKPKHIIAVHIPPAEADRIAAELKKVLPDATAFTRILEERSF